MSGDQPKILITGVSGFVGYNIARGMEGLGQLHATVHQAPVDLPNCEQHQLDLMDMNTVDKVIADAGPDILIHCAAITDVEQCEKDWHVAYTMNVRSTMRFADDIRRREKRMIFISTDLVFGGERGNYRETDIACPLSAYGWTKLIAESHVARAGSRNAILRAALVYGKGPRGLGGFVGWMQRDLEAGKPLRLYQDEYRTPLYVNNLVTVVREVIEENIGGLYHVGGMERINRYDFGVRLANTLGLPSQLIEAAGIEEHRGVKRPRDCSLNIDRASAIFKTEFLTVREGLRLLKEESDSPS
jgi:dTDP-4-dehydrorhamnose reductase